MRNRRPLSVRWDAHGVQGLEDLISHQADLMDALQMFRRFVEVFESNDYTLMDALATAAVIRYCRCFATGVRSTLSIEDLPELTDEERELHQYLVNTRNKHIAHAVNQMETQGVFLGIWQDEQGSMEVTSAHVGRRTQIAINKDQGNQALALSSRWWKHVCDQIAAETPEVERRARRLTGAELRALPQGPVSPSLDPMEKRARRR